MTYMRLNTRRNGSGKRFITRGSNHPSNHPGGTSSSTGDRGINTNTNSIVEDLRPVDADPDLSRQTAHAPDNPHDAPTDMNGKPRPVISYRR